MVNSTAVSRDGRAEILRASWAPWLVFLLHVFISRVLNAYILFPPLDIPMHFFGGVAIAYFLAACLRAVPAASTLSRFVSAVLLFCFTCTASCFWEFAEFFSDLLFGTHAQLGLADTLLDMALGTGGGTVYVLWALKSRRLGVPVASEPAPNGPSRPVA